MEMIEMAVDTLETAAERPDGEIDPKKGATWRVRTGPSNAVEVTGWKLEITSGGALVLRGGDHGQTLIQAWGPGGWLSVEPSAPPAGEAFTRG